MATVKIQFLNVEVPRRVSRGIESRYCQAFDRLEHLIAQAKLKLQDTNGPKGGEDKHCTLQVRFLPRGTAVVKSSGSSFAQAAHNAFEKMQRVAAKRLCRRKNRPRDLVVNLSED